MVTDPGRKLVINTYQKPSHDDSKTRAPLVQILIGYYYYNSYVTMQSCRNPAA